MLVTVVTLSRIAGVPVECPTLTAWAADSERVTGSADHAGYFDYQRHVIGLRPDVCGTLRQLLTIRPSELLPDAYDIAGFSVFTFAHEIQHSLGVTDETQADCGAARTFAQTATKLGVARQLVAKIAAASRRIDGYHPAAIASCWPRSHGS